MKRIIGLFLCLIFICTVFVGCNGNNDKDKITSDIDVEYYAKLGKMPECQFSLGADVDEVDEKLKEIYNDSDEAYYDVIKGKNSVLIDGGTFMYYYEKEKKDKGVSLIVNNDTAYGFEGGTFNIEITEALSDYEYEEITDIENELFFLKSFEGVSGIKYTFGDNIVIFAFSDNALTATAIYSIENWTL